MDFMNNNWKEYIERDDKVLASSAIRPAVYWLASFFKTASTVFFISLFPVWITFVAGVATGDKREKGEAAVTIEVQDSKGKTVKTVIPNRPKSESVAEAAKKSERKNTAWRFMLYSLATVYALAWALWGLHYKSFKYIVTSRGVHEVSGLVFKRIKFVPYAKITDTILKRGIFDLIFGTGTIGVSTPGGTKVFNGGSQPYEVRFRSVPDYKKLRELIYKGMK